MENVSTKYLVSKSYLRVYQFERKTNKHIEACENNANDSKQMHGLGIK